MKKGISLIVLVITIIVMIILAASVVITLSDTGIINKASEAVDLTNQSQVQDLAALIWADAYMANKRDEALATEVITKLGEQGIEENKWNIEVSNTGVTVTVKDSEVVAGLGSLITKDNYGDTVDYTVTVDGATYTDWQIYYHNEEYVYLITKDKIKTGSLQKGIKVATLTSDELALYEKFRVGNATKYTLADTVNGYQSYNSQAVAELIKDYANFANTTDYGTNVVGAIGGPTIELLAAGWNAKGYTPTITLTTDTYGYKINGKIYIDVTADELYVPSKYYYWLASPSASDYRGSMDVGGGHVYSYRQYTGTCAFRPVVCLKADIPATAGNGDYDFELVK